MKKLFINEDEILGKGNKNDFSWIACHLNIPPPGPLLVLMNSDVAAIVLILNILAYSFHCILSLQAKYPQHVRNARGPGTFCAIDVVDSGVLAKVASDVRDKGTIVLFSLFSLSSNILV